MKKQGLVVAAMVVMLLSGCTATQGGKPSPTATPHVTPTFVAGQKVAELQLEKAGDQSIYLAMPAGGYHVDVTCTGTGTISVGVDTKGLDHDSTFKCETGKYTLAATANASLANQQAVLKLGTKSDGVTRVRATMYAN